MITMKAIPEWSRVSQSNSIGVSKQGSAMKNELKYLRLYEELVRRRYSLTKEDSLYDYLL